MDITQWIIQSALGSESALAAAQSANSDVLVAYAIISLLIKRASFLGAFFISAMLFECSLFDPLSEASLYLLTFAIYSYVITCNAMTFKQRSACGILLILSVVLAYDAYFYGVDGYHGTMETIVYNNIEYLALYCHLLFICTLIPYRRIKDGLRDMLSFIVHVKGNSAYLVIC